MSDPAEVEAYVTSLKVVELKDELKKRHLSYVGNKPALAQRLREDMMKAIQQDVVKEDEEDDEEEDDEEEEPQQDQEPEPSQEEVCLLPKPAMPLLCSLVFLKSLYVACFFVGVILFGGFLACCLLNNEHQVKLSHFFYCRLV